MSNSSLDRWLEMDTYYFSTSRFLDALDWYANNVAKRSLGVAVMNRKDISPAREPPPSSAHEHAHTRRFDVLPPPLCRCRFDVLCRRLFAAASMPPPLCRRRPSLAPVFPVRHSATKGTLVSPPTQSRVCAVCAKPRRLPARCPVRRQEGYLARFYALDRSGADWLNIFMLGPGRHSEIRTRIRVSLLGSEQNGSCVGLSCQEAGFL